MQLKPSNNKPPRHLSRAIMAKILVVLLLALTLQGCKKTPDGVLPQEKMAQLMADIHLGEAMIDFNYSTYPNDSTRKMLKQSIYTAHGVSPEQVDTSFVWYGNHIEDYIKVYDRTIEIIQERQRSLASASSAQISVAGDSVQVWSGPQRLTVSSRMPSRIIPFNLTPDSTWQKGDIYTLSYKPVNSSADINAGLLVDYADGTTAYADSKTKSGTRPSLQIQLDTTQTPVRVYGYIALSPARNTSYEIDSIALTRIRRELANNANIRQHTFAYGRTPESETEPADSTDVASTTAASAMTTGRQTKRPTATGTVRRTDAATPGNLPKASSELGRSTEHRQDATQHKPTPEQRREAARQRSRANTTVKKQSVQQQTMDGERQQLKRQDR